MLKKEFAINKKSRVDPKFLPNFFGHCSRQTENMERLTFKEAEGTVHCTWIGQDSLVTQLPGTKSDNVDARVISYGLRFYEGQCGCLLYHFAKDSALIRPHVFDCFTNRVVVVPVNGELIICNGDGFEMLFPGQTASFISKSGGFTHISPDLPTWVAVFKQFKSQQVQAQLFDFELF